MPDTKLHDAVMVEMHFYPLLLALPPQHHHSISSSGALLPLLLIQLPQLPQLPVPLLVFLQVRLMPNTKLHDAVCNMIDALLSHPLVLAQPAHHHHHLIFTHLMLMLLLQGQNNEKRIPIKSSRLVSKCEHIHLTSKTRLAPKQLLLSL